MLMDSTFYTRMVEYKYKESMVFQNLRAQATVINQGDYMFGTRRVRIADPHGISSWVYKSRQTPTFRGDIHARIYNILYCSAKAVKYSLVL